MAQPATYRRVALEEHAVLYRAMSMEILKLERHIERIERTQPRLLVASYMLLAVRLRDRLASLSERDLAPETMPSFSRLLTEATSRAYRWAVRELSEMRLFVSKGAKDASEFTRPIRFEDLSVFHDLSRVCARSGDVSTQQLVRTLDAIDDTLYRLFETKDRIELVCDSR